MTMGRSGPPDGGWGWVVVACSFMNHLLLEGYVRSFGLIYLQLLDRYQAGATATTWLQACFNALQQMGIGPFLGVLVERFSCRGLALVGGVAFSAAYLLSAFAPSIYFLYFSYSIVGGLGSGLIYSPIVIIVNDYFAKKRGMAMGLAALGAAAGTFAMPPLILLLFHQFGYTGSFMLLSALALNHCVFAAFYRPLNTSDKLILEKDVLEVDPGTDDVVLRAGEETGTKAGSTEQTRTPAGVEEITSKLNDSNDNQRTDGSWVDVEVQRDEPRVGVESKTPECSDAKYCQLAADVHVHADSCGTSVPNDSHMQYETDIQVVLNGSATCLGAVPPLLKMNDNHVDSSSSLNIVTPAKRMQCGETEMTSSLGVIPTMHRLKSERAKMSSSLGMIPGTKWMGRGRTGSSVAGDGDHLVLNRGGVDPVHPDVSNLRKDPWGTSSSYLACGASLGSVRILTHSRCNGFSGSYKEETGAPHHKSIPDHEDDSTSAESATLLGRLELGRRLAVMRNPSFLMYCFLLFTIPGANTATFIFLPGLAEERGVSDTKAAMLVSVIGVANAIGNIAIGFVFDIPFVSRHRSMFHSSLGLLLAVSVLTMAGTSDFLAMAAIAGWYGFALAGVMGQRANALSQYVTVEQLPSAFGFMIVFQGLGNLVGLTLQGYLKDVFGTYAACFLYGGSMVSVSSLLLICDYTIRIIMRSNRREKSSTL